MARTAFIVAAGLCAIASRASGEGLQWSAPAGCPSAGEVEKQIVERVGRPLPVTVRVQKAHGRYVLEATIAGVERRFDGADCHALAHALVVTAALLAEPPEPPAPPAAPSAPPAEDPLSGPAPPAITEITPSPSGRPFALGLHAKAGVAAFVLPAATFALAPGVFVEVGSARIELAAAYLMTQQTALEGGGTGNADFVGATATSCYVGALGARWQLGACGGGTVGALRVATAGISEPATAVTPFGWLSAGGVARVHLGAGFALFADAALNVHLLRPQFVVETANGAARFFQPAPVGLLVHLGADFRWPSQNR